MKFGNNINGDFMQDILIILFILGLYFLSKHYKKFESKRYDKHIEDLTKLDPREFEFFCADYLKANGYWNVNVTQASNDGGKDIIAYKHFKKYVVECKRYKGSVGRPIVQKLHSAAITSGATGIIMTTGNYTKQAKDYAYRTNIKLIDKKDLVRYKKRI